MVGIRRGLLRSILLVTALNAVASYATAFVGLLLVAEITNVFTYRVGYVALLVGTLPPILMVTDLLLYSYVFRAVTLGRPLTLPGAARLLKHLAVASAPVLLLVAPELVVGVGGVVAEEVFYGAVALVATVWSAILALYAFFVHPVYAPYAGLTIATCVDWGGRTCVFSSMRRYLRLLPGVIFTSIAVLVLTSLAARVLLSVAPPLGSTLLPVPDTTPLQPWSYGWFEALRSTMPRYYNLILGPAHYLLYAYILERVSRRKLQELQRG